MNNHNTDDCGKRNKFPTNNSSNSTPNRDITCYKCNKRGHYASECKSNLPNSANRNPNFNYQNRNSQDGNNSRNTPNVPTSPNRNTNDRRSFQNNDQNSPRNSRYDQNSPRNIRLYDNDIPIEEAIAYAEDTDEGLKN